MSEWEKQAFLAPNKHILHLILHCEKNNVYISKHYVSPLTVLYWDIVFRLVFKITTTPDSKYLLWDWNNAQANLNECKEG